MSIAIVSKIAEYGISFFSIGAIIYIVCVFNKTLQNHINHNTSTLQKIDDSIQMLIRVLGNK